MDFRDRVIQWNEWLNTGNHKAFEQDILEMYLALDVPLPDDVEITVFQQKPYTHTVLYLGSFSLGKSGHGYAKWDNTGEWSEEEGAKITVRRAARRLFRSLQERILC